MARRPKHRIKKLYGYKWERWYAVRCKEDADNAAYTALFAPREWSGWLDRPSTLDFMVQSAFAAREAWIEALGEDDAPKAPMSVLWGPRRKGV